MVRGQRFERGAETSQIRRRHTDFEQAAVSPGAFDIRQMHSSLSGGSPAQCAMEEACCPTTSWSSLRDFAPVTRG